MAEQQANQDWKRTSKRSLFTAIAAILLIVLSRIGIIPGVARLLFAVLAFVLIALSIYFQIKDKSRF